MDKIKGNPYVSQFDPVAQPVLLKECGRTGFRREMLNYPTGVDAKSGDIIVSERDSHRIQILDPFGNETRCNPYGKFGHGKNQLFRPGGVVTTGQSGAHAMVADTGNRRIVFLELKADDHGYGNLSQTYEFGHAHFSRPLDLCVNMALSQLIVTDPGARKVTFHEWYGTYLGDMCPPRAAPFQSPTNAALDFSGRCFITDNQSNSVYAFDRNGDFLFRFGETGHGIGQLLRPWGIAIDQQNNILIGDEGNHRIQMFSPDGKSMGVVAETYYPKGLSINIHGNLVITSEDPYNFLKIIRYK